MEQTVQDRRRHHLVTENRTPLSDGPVAGDKNAASFETPADQLKEQVCGEGLKR